MPSLLITDNLTSWIENETQIIHFRLWNGGGKAKRRDSKPDNMNLRGFIGSILRRTLKSSIRPRAIISVMGSKHDFVVDSSQYVQSQ